MVVRAISTLGSLCTIKITLLVKSTLVECHSHQTESLSYVHLDLFVMMVLFFSVTASDSCLVYTYSCFNLLEGRRSRSKIFFIHVKTTWQTKMIYPEVEFSVAEVLDMSS